MCALGDLPCVPAMLHDRKSLPTQTSEKTEIVLPMETFQDNGHLWRKCSRACRGNFLADFLLDCIFLVSCWCREMVESRTSLKGENMQFKGSARKE